MGLDSARTATVIVRPFSVLVPRSVTERSEAEVPTERQLLTRVIAPPAEYTRHHSLLNIPRRLDGVSFKPFLVGRIRCVPPVAPAGTLLLRFGPRFQSQR